MFCGKIDELKQMHDNGLTELPMIRDPEESWYLRQEHDGYILGPYEKQATPWSVDGVPESFGMELLPADLDPVEHIIESAMQRIPVLNNALVKTVVNGPITFTPDGNPLIGPAFGVSNAWLLTGSSMGVMEGGGAGAFLADWITEDAPPNDALAIDSRRFGAYADRSYRLDKAIECFGLQFGVHYPFEERPASRDRRVTAVKSLQADEGAVFGCAYGWERVNWFQDKNDPVPEPSFRRCDWFYNVERECHIVRASVGLADLSAFSKFRITGSHAYDFIQSLGANSAPTKIGNVRLCHTLTQTGGVASEFSIIRIAEQEYYLVSAASAERHDHDVLVSHQGLASASVENITNYFGILALMGPNAVNLLEELLGTSFSISEFPWLTSRILSIGGVKVRFIRVSYVGESGFELHVRQDKLKQLWQQIAKLGRKYELGYFGAFAMNSMRLEKSYRAWGMDLTTERSPLESGLGIFVNTEDRSFSGKDALLRRHANDDLWNMQLLELDPAGDVDPFYAHPVFVGSEAVGVITSGAYGHRTQKRLALAYLKPHIDESVYRVEILGRSLDAQVLYKPPYDPANNLMRSD